MTPLAHVMDDSGSPGAGAVDSGGPRGLVAMPDTESLRRSVAAAIDADQDRARATAAGPVTATPVSAASSGTYAISPDLLFHLYACLIHLHVFKVWLSSARTCDIPCQVHFTVKNLKKTASVSCIAATVESHACDAIAKQHSLTHTTCRALAHSSPAKCRAASRSSMECNPFGPVSPIAMITHLKSPIHRI